MWIRVGTLTSHFIFLKIYKLVLFVLRSPCFVYLYSSLSVLDYSRRAAPELPGILSTNYITACKKLAFGKSWGRKFPSQKKKAYSIRDKSSFTCFAVRRMHSSLRGSFCIPRRELVFHWRPVLLEWIDGGTNQSRRSR